MRGEGGGAAGLMPSTRCTRSGAVELTQDRVHVDLLQGFLPAVHVGGGVGAPGPVDGSAAASAVGGAAASAVGGAAEEAGPGDAAARRTHCFRVRVVRRAVVAAAGGVGAIGGAGEETEVLFSAESAPARAAWVAALRAVAPARPRAAPRVDAANEAAHNPFAESAGGDVGADAGVLEVGVWLCMLLSTCVCAGEGESAEMSGR